MPSESEKDAELLLSAQKEIANREALKQKRPAFPAASFGPKRFREEDGLSTRPAPAPKGPPTDQLLAEAKQRRRAREQEELTRRG